MTSPGDLKLPSDEDLQNASEDKSTYRDYIKKKPKKIRVLETPREELKYREKKTGIFEREKLCCTTCGKDLKGYLNQPSMISSHALLSVLLCRSCADFYGEGEFSVDEDGTDKYCRWCGQGGTLYLCSECNFGFCRACIKRNLSRSILKEVEEDDWRCFACKPYPLWDLRAICCYTLKFVEEKKKSKLKLENKPHSSKKVKRQIMLSGESDTDDQVKNPTLSGEDKKSHGISSGTSGSKRKRDNSTDENQGLKKNKISSDRSKEETKSQYNKPLDRMTTLNSKSAELLVSKCKEQIGDFFKVLRAVSSEVKNILKEEIIVEKMLDYTGRKQIIKKMTMLHDMSCQSVSQAYENFILAYRSGIVSSVENENASVSGNSSNVDKEHNSNEKHEGENEIETMKVDNNSATEADEKSTTGADEKSTTGVDEKFDRKRKPFVPQFSESDQTDDELFYANNSKETIHKLSNSKSSTENLKSVNCDDTDPNNDNCDSDCDVVNKRDFSKKKHSTHNEKNIQNNEGFELDDEVLSLHDVKLEGQKHEGKTDLNEKNVALSENVSRTYEEQDDKKQRKTKKSGNEKKLAVHQFSDSDHTDEDLFSTDNKKSKNKLSEFENLPKTSETGKSDDDMNSEEDVFDNASVGNRDDSKEILSNTVSNDQINEDVKCDDTDVGPEDSNPVEQNKPKEIISDLNKETSPVSENLCQASEDEKLSEQEDEKKSEKNDDESEKRSESCVLHISDSDNSDGLCSANSCEMSVMEESNDGIVRKKSNCDSGVKGNDDDLRRTQKENRKNIGQTLKYNNSSESDSKSCGEENEKAWLSLLRSESSDDQEIIIRKNKNRAYEKCGPLSSKSKNYQKLEDMHDKDRKGGFSGSGGETEVDSANEQKSMLEEFETWPCEVKIQKCSVVLKRLSEDVYNQLSGSPLPTKDNKMKSGTEEIKKLVDLRSLETSTRKKIPSMDADSESDEDINVNKKKVFRKHGKKKEESEKKEKKTLKDFFGSDEASSQSDHSDKEGVANDEKKEKEGLSDLFDELRKTKNKLDQSLLLRSSDSDSDSIFGLRKRKRDEEKKKKKEKESSKAKLKEESKGERKDVSCKNDESDDEEDELKERRKWRSNKLLCMKLSDTDTSEEERKWERKKAKEIKEEEEKERKKPTARRLINSDSDVLVMSSDSTEVDSDDFKTMIKKKRKKEGSDNNKSEKKSSSESDLSVKKKPKRRRIQKPVSDSSDSEGDGGEVNNSQKSDTTPNKGRKNIRKVMKDDTVAEATRQAAKEEEERRKRIAEKQKLYNALYNLAEAQSETIDKLVLDFDTETKKELVDVDKNLVKKLKPHQVKGVKFMWDACFESLEELKKSEGSGCILAHCMGLGKTLQVITLVHTLLNTPKTGVKTVLVVCPLSTVLNWVNEFSKWLDKTEDNDIEVMEITRYKQMYERTGILKHWHKEGGVMILSYHSYRLLSNPKIKRQRKSCIDILQKTLVDPGPDLVICDEGHLLKNEESAISKSMSQLRTKRRIVLTGTPLQNNLLEYHCMVQFVKPNLLGTKKEFKNRFVNPINNGQYDNSTAHDVKVMKRRAHVLHKMLDSSVQRYDYSVLTPFLPPKFEYVLLIRLTDLQVKLYKYYLDNLSFVSSEGTKTKTARLFSDYQALQRIWTHPRVLLMNSEKQEKKRVLELDCDSEGSLRDFVVSSSSASSSSSSSSDSDVEAISAEESKNHKPRTRNAKSDDEQSAGTNENETNVEDSRSEQWWRKFLSDDSQLDDIKQSGKLDLLFTILEECEKIGDKVLVFSQSLFSLDLIEYFLAMIDEASQNTAEDDKSVHKSSWVLGLDYFRLDGSSSSDNRSAWCKIFNREENYRARLFLISTRAGGLGINLVAANRVILFDCSWNPSYDVQSIFRIYRFGQKKPCYVYRFLAEHTMEEKIYNRQVTKLSLACRVVDEQQIERHYSMDDLQELYNYNPEEKKNVETPLVPKDILLAELVRGEGSWVTSYHEHDTLLENKEEEELNEDERKAAWEDYEKEKQGLRPSVAMYDNSALIAYLNKFGYSEQQIRDSIIRENPQWSETQVQYHVSRVLRQIFEFVSAQEYRKQIQAQFNMNQVQQPVFYQAPQIQGQTKVWGPSEPQMKGPQTGPLVSQLQSTITNLMQSTPQQPGSSTTTDSNQRIKVKSFGHMQNSNFGSSKVIHNPFALQKAMSSNSNNYPTNRVEKGLGLEIPLSNEADQQAVEGKSSGNLVTDVIEVE